MYTNAPAAPDTTKHTLTVNISGANYFEDADAIIKASTPISVTNQIPDLCPSDDPFDKSSVVLPAGAEFYIFHMSYNKLEDDVINGQFFDPSGTIPSNNYGYIGIEYEAANGCVSVDELSLFLPTVNESPELTLDTSTEATCGLVDGTASVIPFSPTSSIIDTYWSNGTTGTSVTGLESDVYQAYTINDFGCKAKLDVAIGSDAISSTLNTTPPTCWYDKGNIDLDVSSPLNYEVWWDFGVYGEDHTNLEPTWCLLRYNNRRQWL